MKIFARVRLAVFFLAPIGLSSAASGDVFTPVIGSTLTQETHAVHGTNNAYHIVYELQLQYESDSSFRP